MHTAHLMHELDQKGHEVHFLGSCKTLFDLFKKHNFDSRKAWLMLSFFTPICFLMAGLQLLRARKLWGVDTIYMVSLPEKILMTPWAKRWNMKIIWVEHKWPGKQMNFWEGRYKRASEGVEILVTTEHMKEQMKHRVDGNLRVIPWGVMAVKPAPLPAEVEAFLDSGFVLGFVGRLSVDKGVDMMVKLVHSKPDMRLILVGDGPLRKTVQIAAQNGQVMWLPSLTRGQLMTLYKGLDLLALPSTKDEAFGMVAAEAMFFGTPVVVSDKCGLSSELSHGEQSWVVRPKFADLDKAVKRLMRDHDLRRGLGERGKGFVRSHYKLTDMVKEVEGVLTH